MVLINVNVLIVTTIGGSEVLVNEICTSLQLSRDIADAGIVIKDPVMMWVSDNNIDWMCTFTTGYNYHEWPAYVTYKYKVPAATADELLSIIPYDRANYELTIFSDHGELVAGYPGIFECRAIRLCDILAQIAIWINTTEQQDGYVI